MSETEAKRPVNFYGIDGDKIGSTIELHILEGDIDTLGKFSHQVASVLEDVRDIVLQNKGTVVLCAGDSILFQGSFDVLWCENILRLFRATTGCTASMGVGATAIESYLALKLAKARGGGKVVTYSLLNEDCHE